MVVIICCCCCWESTFLEFLESFFFASKWKKFLISINTARYSLFVKEIWQKWIRLWAANLSWPGNVFYVYNNWFVWKISPVSKGMSQFTMLPFQRENYHSLRKQLIDDKQYPRILGFMSKTMTKILKLFTSLSLQVICSLWWAMCWWPSWKSLPYRSNQILSNSNSMIDKS